MACEMNNIEINSQCAELLVGPTYSRVAYIYVRSRAKYLKFRTTTSKINTLRKLLMQQKYYFVDEM